MDVWFSGEMNIKRIESLFKSFVKLNRLAMIYDSDTLLIVASETLFLINLHQEIVSPPRSKPRMKLH